MSFFQTRSARAAHFARMMGELFLALALAALSACGGGGGGDARALPLSAATAVEQNALKAAPILDPALMPQSVSIVNSTMVGQQAAKVIGALMDGGYTVAWLSTGEPGNTTGTYRLFIQRYDANGAKVGGEVLVPFDFTAQASPAIAVMADGSVMVAYRTSSTVIVASGAAMIRTSITTERYDAGGAPMGAPDEVAYIMRSVGGEGQIDLIDPYILTWLDGSYLIAWTRLEQVFPYSPVLETVAQRYGSDSVPAGAPRKFGRYAAGDGSTVKLSAMQDGGFLAAFTIFDQGLQYMRFYPYDSAERTAPIPAYTPGSGYPTGTLVLPLSDGGYVLWSNDNGVPYTQVLDSSGALVAAPAIARGDAASALSDGSFVVFWHHAGVPLDQPNWTAQRYDSAGVALGNRILLNTKDGSPLITSLADVGIALAWTGSALATGLDVYTQVLREQETARQAIVRACGIAAQGLQGAEHKKFMSNCLKGN